MGWPARRLVSRRGVRIVLGVLWLIDAALQAEPAKFNPDYPLGDLAQAVMGAPAWVNQSVFAGLRPFAAHWPWWNLAATLLQGVIGAALITGRAVRPILVVSFVWAFTVWWLGEAFGTLTTGLALLAAGAPGSVLLYALLGALAWPQADRRDVDRRWWTIAWVVLWLGTTVVQLRSSFPPGEILTANLHDASTGQPRLLHNTATSISRLVAQHPSGIWAALVVVQVAVAVGCLVDRRHPRRWLGLGIGLSLFFWVVFQQLGGIFTSSATDLNTAPLVILLAFAAWPERRDQSEPVLRGDRGHAKLPIGGH